MSMGRAGKATNKRQEGVAIQASAERESMFGEMPGQIVSFNPNNQTATIRPLYKPTHDGKKVDMPELQEVPVRFQRIGGFVVTAPVKEGDMVMLRPQQRSTEEYHTGGDHESIKESRSMSLSDMEAFLDGGEKITDPISNFNTENFEIRSEDGRFKMEMSEDGKFKMEGAQGNWYDLMAKVVELLAEDNLNVKYGSSAGSGHALEKRSEYASIAAKLRAMAL